MSMSKKAENPDVAEMLEFMFRLGQAYLASGEQTAQIELLLRRIATTYGFRRARVIAFPTAIFISVFDGEEERVTLAEGPTQTLRLDQIAAVYKLGAEVQRGDVSPSAGLKRLTEIQRMKARFGRAGILIGHILLTVGLSMVVMPATSNLIAAAILGAVVGALKVLYRDRPILAVPLPVVAAAIVSALVFLGVKYELPIDPRYAIIPPLVSFLPGAMLTLGMVELAYGDMVSGSSRLTTGFVQLVLLVFGLATGAILAGYRPENLSDVSNVVIDAALASWMPWAGVLLFGIGAFFHFSAPRNSLGWMLVVLLIVFAIQRISAEAVGNAAGSGFFAMLLVTPLGYLIQLKFKGPPAIVTFLPSFWLIVPGTVGLRSVTLMLSDRDAAIDGLISAIFALASIALGSLVGVSLYKWLTETFGWWQLQLGRVESYLRRRRRR